MNRQLMRLGHNIEEMCCVCEEEMELCKKTLIMNGICDSSNVYQVYTNIICIYIDNVIDCVYVCVCVCVCVCV